MTDLANIIIADSIWRETKGVISYDNASKLAVRLINGPLTRPNVLKILIQEAESRGRTL